MAQWFWRGRFFNFVDVFYYFVIISPWERVWSFIFHKLEFLSPKDALWQVWLKLTQWFLRRRFLNFVNVFHYFIITSISPLKRAWPFIWTNFKSLHPRMLCAKLSWNWSASREKDENMKRLQTDGQTDRRTDNRRPKKLTWALSSVEIKHQKK